MKKKIKDLTLNDCRKICDNHYLKHYSCNNCPLVHRCGTNFSRDCDFEEEIEVEEDKPQKCKDLRGCC